MAQIKLDRTNNDHLDRTVAHIDDNFNELYAKAGKVVAGGAGTFTANGVTGIPVADTSVTANSLILITLKTVGGTVGSPFVDTITPGTGFNVKSQASDTSTYNYQIIN